MTVDWNWLVSSGFSFFPLLRGSKKPAMAWKPYQTCRPTADEVAGWRNNADSNAAIVTGAISGIIVLDTDSDEGEAFVIDQGAPETPTVRTAKGRHRYFRHPGFKIGNLAGIVAGVDLRGDGGYVVAPGSLHPSGHVYEWEAETQSLPVADAPQWLLDIIRKPEPAAIETRPASGAMPTVGLGLDEGGDRYARAALEGEIAKLWRAEVLTRNDSLNSSAFSLGTMVGGGHLNRAEVEDRLMTTAIGLGLGERESKATIRSGLDAGCARPRPIPERPTINDLDTDNEAPEWRLSNGAESSLTEDAVASLFTERHRKTMRFDHDAGIWFRWSGDHWARDATRSAFEECRLLAREASEPFEFKDQTKVRRASFVLGVERFARSDPAHAVKQGVWDRNPLVVGAPGVTIELMTGAERKPDPADHVTKRLSVAPAKTADCPRWIAFLNEATGDDAEMVRYLKRLCGYALTGDTREHKLFFIYGPGGNGKSVFLNVVMSILGDYGQTAAMDTFTASNSDRHPTDLAALRGARLVTATETEEGRAWAESRIKQLTGGDAISARFMRQDYFTFKPQFKLVIAGNHKPALRNVDDAARRRFNLIPFTRTPAAPDLQLEQKLLAEAPAILRWMIEGCLEWLQHGLGRPAAVERETASYFSDQDIFAQWLEDECIVDVGNEFRWEAAADLFASWGAYAKAAGEDPGNMKRFGGMMSRAGCERGFKKYLGKSARVWTGLNRRTASGASHGGA